MKIYKYELPKKFFIVLSTESEKVESILSSWGKFDTVIEIISLQYHEPGHIFSLTGCWNTKQLITKSLSNQSAFMMFYPRRIRRFRIKIVNENLKMISDLIYLPILDSWALYLFILGRWYRYTLSSYRQKTKRQKSFSLLQKTLNSNLWSRSFIFKFSMLWSWE